MTLVRDAKVIALPPNENVQRFGHRHPRWRRASDSTTAQTAAFAKTQYHWDVFHAARLRGKADIPFCSVNVCLLAQSAHGRPSRRPFLVGLRSNTPPWRAFR
jgi:hypothetical protein